MRLLLPIILAIFGSCSLQASTAGAKTPALAESARVAASKLSRNQTSGFWLTHYTASTRYEQSAPELNTFTNALLVDLLDPIAVDAGLAEATARARQFLSSQIEEDGLVRYHGRPDAWANRGFWVCTITPDPDDTVLAWRIAPAADVGLRATALGKIAEYRAENGLYKTWLAPESAYQCINPGKDPNPTDVGIQMHIHMLLAEVDPPAAEALCTSLRREVANDANWVYYTTSAPLVPLLRLAAMRGNGCPLDIEPARLQTIVPEQAAWVEVANLSARFEANETTRRDRDRAGELLQLFANDDFALAERAPPLIYHNDFTASVSRFYWSEDVGYAMWLRLYHASRGGTASP